MSDVLSPWKLLICGGEDVPGMADTLTLEQATEMFKQDDRDRAAMLDIIAAANTKIELLKAAGDGMEGILQVIEAMEEEGHILSDIDAALTVWSKARDTAT